MKSTFKSKINSIQFTEDGNVVVNFQTLNGKVQTQLLNAQQASLKGELVLKKVAAKDIKIGSVIKIEVSIEDDIE